MNLFKYLPGFSINILCGTAMIMLTSAGACIIDKKMDKPGENYYFFNGKMKIEITPVFIEYIHSCRKTGIELIDIGLPTSN